MDTHSGSGQDDEVVAANPPRQEWSSWDTASSWQDGSRIRIAQLRALSGWLRDQDSTTLDRSSIDAATAFLSTAESELDLAKRGWRRLRTKRFEDVLFNCDAAERVLLGAAPGEYLYAELPDLQVFVGTYLPIADPRRIKVEQLAARARADNEGMERLDRSDRLSLVDAATAARRVATGNQLRLARYRAVLVVGCLVAAGVACSLTVLGALAPSAFPLCFASGEGGDTFIACPIAEEGPLQIPRAEVDEVQQDLASPGDVLTVEVVGMAAAAVIAIRGLRSLRGGSGPYGLAVPLVLIKVVTGALTAVIGLLLLRGGFVPGLTALDSSAQILAWAAIGGLAQTLATRPLDNNAQSLLEQVGQEPAATSGMNEEAVLRQVTLSMPALGPRLQESLIESALGKPTPPYDGYVALQTGREEPLLPLSEPRPESGQVTIWFQPAKATSTVSAPVRVQGTRWPPRDSSDEAQREVLHFDVRLHVPDSPRSPYSIAIPVPQRGASERVTIQLGKLPRTPSAEPSILEVSHHGRVVQAVEFPRSVL